MVGLSWIALDSAHRPTSPMLAPSISSTVPLRSLSLFNMLSHSVTMHFSPIKIQKASSSSWPGWSLSWVYPWVSSSVIPGRNSGTGAARGAVSDGSVSWGGGKSGV